MKINPISTDNNKVAYDAGLRKTAEDFEAIFMEKLLLSMRRLAPNSSLIPKGPGRDLYEGMMYQTLAQNMAKSGGLGIADLLYRELMRSSNLS